MGTTLEMPSASLANCPAARNRVHYGPMIYASPVYARETFNAAGNALIGKDTQGLGLEQSLGIINNWRSSHALPLNALHVTLRGRAKKVDPNVLTAQRLKRLSSIEAKLRRFPAMKLTQMQDIGGCRAVVKDVAEVEKLVAAYRVGVAKNPKKRHAFLSEKDYIDRPKPDGYRGHHLVYRYHSRAKKHSAYNGLKAECAKIIFLSHAANVAPPIQGCKRLLFYLQTQFRTRPGVREK